MNQANLGIIGANTRVDIIGLATNVPAKVDTGADSSAIWASDIHVDTKGMLHYKLFGEGSPLYTGVEHITNKFSVAGVISSSGHRQIRYRVKIPLQIADKRIIVALNLSDRSKQLFPILLGRRTLKGRFLVDVSKRPIKNTPRKSQGLNKEMQENPYEFYRKYHEVTRGSGEE